MADNEKIKGSELDPVSTKTGLKVIGIQGTNAKKTIQLPIVSEPDKNSINILEGSFLAKKLEELDNNDKMLFFDEIITGVGVLPGSSSVINGRVVFVKDASYDSGTQSMFAFQAGTKYYSSWAEETGYPARDKYQSLTGTVISVYSDRFFFNKSDSNKYSWNGSEFININEKSGGSTQKVCVPFTDILKKEYVILGAEGSGAGDIVIVETLLNINGEPVMGAPSLFAFRSESTGSFYSKWPADSSRGRLASTEYQKDGYFVLRDRVFVGNSGMYGFNGESFVGTPPIMHYTSEEKDTGELWHDGRKIYQNTIIYAGSLPGPQQGLEFPHGIQGISQLVKRPEATAYIEGDTMESTLFFPAIDIETGYQADIFVDENNVRMYKYGDVDFSAYNMLIVNIKYVCNDR